jgi:hypothetical protein
MQPLRLWRPGPLLFKDDQRQGNGTGTLSKFMADFDRSPCFGEAGHGICRQSFEV